MKNKILLGLGILLLMLPVACSIEPEIVYVPVEVPVEIEVPIIESVVFSQTSSNTTAGDIMIVFYIINDEQYLFWCDLTAKIIDNGDTWDVESPQVVARGINKATVTYGYYQYKLIEQPYDEEGNPLPIYMADLDLQPPAADDLPKSEHIGKLVAVNATLVKPATVMRKWMGVDYTVQCLVTESMKDMWQAGDIVVGDYVLVSFIEEIPNTTERNIAIVTDKIYKSW